MRQENCWQNQKRYGTDGRSIFRLYMTRMETSEWRDGNWIGAWSKWGFEGPIILDSEVTNAIEALKVGKAIGPDGIPAEFWKVLGAKGIRKLVELCKKMYVKGIWPSDFTRVCDDSFAEKDECSWVQWSSNNKSNITRFKDIAQVSY